MQAWIPVVSSCLYFRKSVFSFWVDSILKWRVYIKQKVSWLHAFLWCMSQTSRDRVNSRHVRTHEKNSGDAVRRLGTIIQSIFCAQSGASIRMRVGTLGHLCPCLKTFAAPFLPARLTAPRSPRMQKNPSFMTFNATSVWFSVSLLPTQNSLSLDLWFTSRNVQSVFYFGKYECNIIGNWICTQRI